MALDIYSKGTTDTLLAAKLDLAGGTMTGGLTLSASGIIFSDSTYLTTAPAGSTLAADQLTAGVVTANPTAGPTASGDVLQYDGSALVWAPGGGGTPFNGGAITNPITIAGATIDSEMSSDFFGVELSADTSKGSVLYYTGLDTYDGSSHMLVGPTGLTFPDATTQSTAGYPNSNPSGFQTASDVSTYVTGLGYLTDAPSDGFAYNRKDGAWEVAGSGGAVAWGSIYGTVTDQTDLTTYISGLGYQTASDVSTYVGANFYSISNPNNFTTASDARKQALVESFRAVVNDAGIGFDGGGYLFLPLNYGAFNNPVTNGDFSSSGKWFGFWDSVGATISPAMSVSLSSGVVAITFSTLSSPPSGYGLFYTEDGGSTWYQSTFKLA